MAVVPEPVAANLLSDEQLLARHAAGERSALDELFRRHRSAAYRVAYRLLGQEADALDAVQDGFVKALSRIDGFEGRSSFKTWLLRVVSNAALDLGRKRGRRDTVPEDDGESLAQLAVPDNPSAGLERHDLRRQLNTALAELPEAQRQTFVLHAEGELSYKEVAETLGISIGTVMSRLFYARQRLKVALSECALP